MNWRRFFECKRRDRDFAEELSAYLEHEIADNMARGMNRDDARSAAACKLGNRTLIQGEIHRMNSLSFLESIWQDLLYGARSLGKSPGFTTVAVLSLALGVGANTAIFQLLDAVRLRSLPVKNPQELAEVRIVGGNNGIGLNETYGELTRPVWEEIRRDHPSFSAVFAWSADRVMTGEGSGAQRAYGLFVTNEFFRVLGVQPWCGRFFSPSDEHSCPESTAIVSYAYWQSKLGGRELSADSTLEIDGARKQIVGVAPANFPGLAVGERFDVALPFCRPNELRRDLFDVTVMGRLRPGKTLTAASAQLAAQSPGVMAATEIRGYNSSTTETYRKFRLGAYSASAGVSQIREQYDSSLWLLLGITGLVLLIACANLANLMLARGSVRVREIGVRLAIGAGRFRVLQQWLVESCLLAFLGAVIGIALAGLLSRVLVASISSGDDAVFLNLGLDWQVLLFSATLAVMTAFFSGRHPRSKRRALTRHKR